MWVKEVIIDGFKSYAVRTVINGWDKSFNAITGLNGSGKSNILDAICFVLGISNLSQVRVNNLTELVYKQGQARVTKATVTIVFDNSDPKMSPVGFEECKEITVARQIQIGGRNKYLINGAVAQLGRVQNLFHSVQLNVNNPHFLIMQGRITKVCNMKPPELLALIEEAAGTRMYETKKKAAQKTIAKKQQKVDEINKTMTEEIAPQLERLRKERSTYLAFQANAQESERLQRFVIAFTFFESETTLKESAAVIKAEEDAAAAAAEEVASAKKELNDNAAETKRLTADKEAELAKNSKNENEVQSRSKVLTQHTSAWTNKKETFTSEQKAHAGLIAQQKDTAKAMDDKAKEIARETKAQEKDNKKHEALTERHASLEGTLLGFSVGGDGKQKEQGSLASQLMSAQAQAAQLETGIKDLVARVKHMNSQRAAKAKAQKATENEYAQLSAEVAAKQKELKSVESKLAKLAVDPAAKADCEKQVTKLSKEVAGLNDELMVLRHRTAPFDFKYADPSKGFDRSLVYGCVAKLFAVAEPKAAMALEVIGGAKLQNVVVDSQETASQLLERGKLAKRTVFIPLDKIAPHTISAATVAKAEKLVGKDKVQPAMELITFDPKLRGAMELTFGNTFVCADAKTAERVAYDPAINTKCVTLDGDMYDPNGTLRGGSRRSDSMALPMLARLREAEHKLKSAEKELNALQKRLSDLTAAEQSAAALSSQRDLLADEVKLHSTRLAQSSKAQLDNELQTLAQQIATAEQEAANAKAEQERCEAKAKELERSIKDFESERASKLKSAEKELAKVKAEMNASLKEAKKRSQALEKLKLESEQLSTESESVAKQIGASEQGLERLSAEVAELEAVVAAKRVWFDEAKAKFDAEKQKIVDADKSLTKLAKERKRLQQVVSDKELEVKKYGHKVTRLIGEQKEAKERVRAMAERHDWLTAEKHLFGRAGSDYDFGRDNKRPAEAAERLKKLKSEQETLSKRINKKVMGMFETAEREYSDLMKKRQIIERDKQKIEEVIVELDRKKDEALKTTHSKVTKDFGSIFGALLPGTTAKLEATKADDKEQTLSGLEMRVAFGGVWKDSLSELSGGQRSLLALSLILALLLFKPAPMYILDEIDAALDLSHTQNIGQMLKTHFPQSQFIVVSLKEGMFNNANVIFRTKFVDGVSCVTRTALAQPNAAVVMGAGAGGKPAKRK